MIGLASKNRMQNTKDSIQNIVYRKLVNHAGEPLENNWIYDLVCGTEE